MPRSSQQGPYFDTDGRGEVVVLLAGGLEEGEAHLDLALVLGSPVAVPVAGGGDLRGLRGREVEGELLVLEASRPRGLEGARLHQRGLDLVERKLTQGHIRKGGVHQVAGNSRTESFRTGMHFVIQG